MNKKFEIIIKHLIGTNDSLAATSGLDISSQFSQHDGSSQSINAAFLILLAGDTHPLYKDAKAYFLEFDSLAMVQYYHKILALIEQEIDQSDEEFFKNIDDLYAYCIEETPHDKTQISEKTWKLFFPQAAGITNFKEEKIKNLREKRKINITKLNDSPIDDISKEMLFTSNILITLPPASKDINALGLSDSLIKTLKEVSKEEQRYWYDHPIQIGVEFEKNEAIYGLIGLNDAITFEKQRGTLAQEDKINCLLSVSVTHEGLTTIAKEYLEGELKKGDTLNNLNIFVITEADSKEIVSELLTPSAHAYKLTENDALAEVFGVDGEYGRHYSLLKAIAALWQVLIEDKTKATFKFDLDQIFPQEELVQQSGSSAFEHFKTPLWGAEGTDSDNQEIELGMLAGALVNQSDIQKSLFTADVTFPTKAPTGSQMVFYSTLPQALSTQAEMMLKYDSPHYDGVKSCIQRIHVTGGTNGILIESLRKHRPFTPIFIGRAEDQAYILSVLFNDEKRNLRYVHKDGLIMRHDKHAFAQESIQAAHLGKMVGDYVRILYFSHYVHALPYHSKKIKETINPFTGSFVSDIPFTVVALRMALEASTLFSEGEEADAFLQLGIQRVDETIKILTEKPNALAETFQREKSAWDSYYDILDALENAIEKEDDFALALQTKAKALIKKFQITQI